MLFSLATRDHRHDFGASFIAPRCTSCDTRTRNRGCASCSERLCKNCFSHHKCVTCCLDAKGSIGRSSGVLMERDDDATLQSLQAQYDRVYGVEEMSIDERIVMDSLRRKLLAWQTQRQQQQLEELSAPPLASASTRLPHLLMSPIGKHNACLRTNRFDELELQAKENRARWNTLVSVSSDS